MEELIREKSELMETVIKQYLPKEEGQQKLVIEAMNYSILAGGKRLRSMLMYETYRLFGGKSRVIEPFMAAIEMIHTYSLVHDDLPAMDDDEFRRGRKTTHVVYGEAMGILAGDGLLNYAFETALSAFALTSDHKNVSKALMILAQKAGIHGMLGGQAVDVKESDQPLKLEQLKFIYELKTGALIEASMLIGAVLAGATKNEQKLMEQTAKDIGLAFQIQDDILDVAGDASLIGKPVGSDEKNHKTTYVSLVGLEAARAEVASLSKNAVERMDQLVVRNEFLTQLILELIQRKK